MLYNVLIHNFSVLIFLSLKQIVATETKTTNQSSSTATVSISISNTNDNMPEFKNAPFSANVSENQTTGATVTTIQVICYIFFLLVVIMLVTFF